MKKILYILYFLLFILILTCIYQKTSSLSEVSSPNYKHSAEKTSIIQKKTIVQKSLEQTNSIKKIKPKEIQKQAVHSIIKTPTNPTTKKIDTFIKKVSIIKPKIIKEAIVPNIKKIKKDITNDFLSALSNRNIALKNRDALESQLQTLIDKALNQRIIAIEHSNKILFKAQERQKEIIIKRDNLSQEIIENKGNK